MKLTSKQLGDLGEDHAASLLRERGYAVEKLPVNAPTYDLRVIGQDAEFFVSVKVSRTKPHIALVAVHQYHDCYLEISCSLLCRETRPKSQT